MAINFIKYREEQMQNMEVSGYSVYINENHWSTHDDLIGATEEVGSYHRFNQVEIYPILKQQERVMSKIKEQMMLEQEQEFELELSYQEWLRDNFSEPSESDVNEMEQDFITKPHFVENQILSESSLNNPNYDPLRGA